jgi:hypothetical protein
MKSTLRGRFGRLGISLVVALAIMGGVGAGFATSTSVTHACLKWNERSASTTHPTPVHPSQAQDPFH